MEHLSLANGLKRNSEPEKLPASKCAQALDLARLAKLKRQTSQIHNRVIVLLRPRNSLMDEVDRKSTRLNSSHGYISYAVFCLKKKKRTQSNYEYDRSHSRALPICLQPFAYCSIHVYVARVIFYHNLTLD